MRLSRDKNGKLGVHMGSYGEQAVVKTSPAEANYGDVYLSNEGVNQAEILEQRRVEHEARKAHAQAINRHLQAQAEQLQAQHNADMIRAQKIARGPDRENEILKAYFTRRASMGETELMNRSVKADFYDREQTPDDDFFQNMSPRADYTAQAITGSPLTRDGGFGPSTDWDRFVQAEPFARDVTGDDGSQIVGGTMLGQYNGRSIKYKRNHLAGRKRRLAGAVSGMGWDDEGYDDSGDYEYEDDSGDYEYEDDSGEYEDDETLYADETSDEYDSEEYAEEDYEEPDDVESEEDSEPGFLSNLWGGIAKGFTSGTQKAADKGVQRLLSEGEREVAKRSYDVAHGSGSYEREVEGRHETFASRLPIPSPAAIAQKMGVQPWAVYAGLGIIGAGTLFVIYKKMQRKDVA